MSQEIENGTKSVAITKEERTYSVYIYTPKNKPYAVRIHREVVESHDGEIRLIDKQGAAVPVIEMTIAEIMAIDGLFTYTDNEGVDKYIPIKDMPLAVSAFCDAVATIKKDLL